MSKSVHSNPFFHGFLQHMLSYAKFILMAVGGECRSVILSYHFMEDQPPTVRHWKYHKISKYLVYLINSKTTYDCLT